MGGTCGQALDGVDKRVSKRVGKRKVLLCVEKKSLHGSDVSGMAQAEMMAANAMKLACACHVKHMRLEHDGEGQAAKKVGGTARHSGRSPALNLSVVTAECAFSGWWLMIGKVRQLQPREVSAVDLFVLRWWVVGVNGW